MSLVLSVYVREGIVMAADSRLTLTFPPDAAGRTLSLAMSDSAKKLFLAPNNIGIATFGSADINGMPIAGFLDSFIVERLKGKELSTQAVTEELKVYFKDIGVRPNTMFHVSGYEKVEDRFEQFVFQVDPAADSIVRLNPANMQGVNWGGEIDVLQRLLNDVALIQDPHPPARFPSFGIPFEFFTLQDAIDFCVYGIRSTIETLRFQSREKTVGGPIDVLVITPDSSMWISQKQLVVSD